MSASAFAERAVEPPVALEAESARIGSRFTERWSAVHTRASAVVNFVIR